MNCRPPANKTAPGETLCGRVSCNWDEYENAQAMVYNIPRNAESFDGRLVTFDTAKPDTRAKVPAYEDALTFLPDWVMLTGYSDGLVEAWAPSAI